MSWPLLIRPEAEKDLFEARNWYDQRRRGLGDEFLDEIAAAMLRLGASPERERLYYRNFRRIIVQRFPYKIFYQILGDRVVIFAYSTRSRNTGGASTSPKPDQARNSLTALAACRLRRRGRATG